LHRFMQDQDQAKRQVLQGVANRRAPASSSKQT
jgi:hypothetical protein